MRKLIAGSILASIVTSSALAVAHVWHFNDRGTPGSAYAASANETPNEVARDAACADGCN